ncbi:MAG: outer membrane lipoprotein-sorting protein [Rhodobacteraceae bacterium]|nr:outer membrane lipoprotein-sorting protein [Paracoccaceae bacterium]
MTATLSRRNVMLTLGAATMLAVLAPVPAAAQDARAILKSAFDNWRARSSHATVEMVVKRPGATRTMTLESWTEGEDNALVRFTAPARDAGNATLQLGSTTYVFNPKLNQVIKLPASAMTQSWMGSDFSYDDLSRSEKVVDDYTHTLIATKSAGGRKLYVIESIPKRGKPIVWGKQVLTVREDGVLYSVEYFDQLGKRVRVMTSDRISNLGGRPYPVVMTMKSDDKPGQYTRVTTKAAEFDISIPAYLFTRSNLQNPRD